MFISCILSCCEWIISAIPNLRLSSIKWRKPTGHLTHFDIQNVMLFENAIINHVSVCVYSNAAISCRLLCFYNNISVRSNSLISVDNNWWRFYLRKHCCCHLLLGCAFGWAHFMNLDGKIFGPIVVAHCAQMIVLFSKRRKWTVIFCALLYGIRLRYLCSFLLALSFSGFMLHADGVIFYTFLIDAIISLHNSFWISVCFFFCFSLFYRHNVCLSAGRSRLCVSDCMRARFLYRICETVRAKRVYMLAAHETVVFFLSLFSVFLFAFLLLCSFSFFRYHFVSFSCIVCEWKCDLVSRKWWSVYRMVCFSCS